jgi:hypothetical protein
MIRYLRHNEIDPLAWDQCINRSINRRVFAFSWYLNIISPGWDALVEDDYETVFPLTHNRKFGINYLYQPFFAQQLGVFSDCHLTEELVERFLLAIPKKFSFLQINLNSLNKADPQRYSVIYRPNFELDLIHPYEKLALDYNQNTRRNIKKGIESNLAIRRKVEPDELITLFVENFGKQEGKLRFRNYETLRLLMNYCLKNSFSKIIGIYSPGESLCAGVFLLETDDRIIFHFAASNQTARENGAMFLLVDSVIRENAGKPVIFDFEGSVDENVARFYKGFGASEFTYPQITLSRMPRILENTVNLLSRLR